MAPPRKRRIVALNNLSWKAVPLPERLEDAEGFYGLEEVDDVEVVKDASSSMLSFRAINTATSDTESEWQGFDDDQDSTALNPLNDTETEAKNGENASPKPKDQAKSSKKKEKKNQKTKQKQAKKEAIVTTRSNDPKDSGFQHLQDQEEEGSGDVDVSAWDRLKISADITTALSRMKFSKPTPIQTASIPEAIKGHDVIGKASTGSGKTLAYGIPILEKFLASRRTDSRPIALILAPTRELAHQISKHLSEISSRLPSQGPRFATITGGLSIYKQQRQLKDADIVIGTPGRLWEVINSETGLLTSLRQIHFLVVDEADRLLSEGHFKEVEEILKSLDRKDVNSDDLNVELARPNRQTLVFSATFQRGLQRKLSGKGKQSDRAIMSQQESMDYLLEKLNFREETPQYVDVNPVSQMAQSLKEGLVECGATEKDLYLYALLMCHPKARTLIFTNSISAVRRITPYLQNLNLRAQALHSQMPQKARLRAIERFSGNSNAILVATDVAARGLDIPDVQLVLHYHVPRQADVYVHRSGRTARAENAGASILLCAPDEVVPVRRLVAKIHAQNAAQKPKPAKSSVSFFIRSIDLDRQIVSRLKERADLSKKIADVELAKEKHHSEDSWLKKAAEELGVDYDSEEFAQNEAGGKKGPKGRKRRERETEARSVSKQEVSGLKNRLKSLLSQRVNLGVSERYLTAGGLDIDGLLRERGNENTETWLGQVDLVGLEARDDLDPLAG